jgi:hypothetical protein
MLPFTAPLKRIDSWPFSIVTFPVELRRVLAAFNAAFCFYAIVTITT